MEKRPNILFLMSDQHRPDVTGYEGNAVVRTPVLDELARTGVIFRNAYTPSPVCVPGRQCMMAGQLPETCECRHFGEDLPPGHMTFAKRFAQYAYHTVCAGKLHHVGPDQMQGWTRRIAPDAGIDDGYIEGRLQEEFEKYSAPAWTRKWSTQKEIERAGIGEGPYQEFDAFTIAETISFLKRYFADPYYDRTAMHRPLFMKVSFLQPHYPFLTDEARFNYYLNRVPVFTDKPSDFHPVLSRHQVGPEVHAAERDVRRATAAYYGMIERVDSYFGQLMDTLRHLGQDLNDWIIIYTSDHGEMLGQHGIWEKLQFYEASVRVPLIIRSARHFDGGQVKEENVNLCDLFATLCDCCDIAIPAGLDSRSLIPLMRGNADGWNNETVSQYGRDRVMIKQDLLKYQYYGENVPEVLFDLRRNPDETENFAKDPNYADEMAKFHKRLAELGHGRDGDPNYSNAGY